MSDEAIPLRTVITGLPRGFAARNDNKNMKEDKYYFVYISTNHPRHTVLYTGVTDNVLERDNQHKRKINPGSFTARYNVNRIVYYEMFTDIYNAIAREKQIKAGSRMKKIELINSINPEWNDLTEEESLVVIARSEATKQSRREQ